MISCWVFFSSGKSRSIYLFPATNKYFSITNNLQFAVINLRSAWIDIATILANIISENFISEFYIEALYLETPFKNCDQNAYVVSESTNVALEVFFLGKRRLKWPVWQGRKIFGETKFTLQQIVLLELSLSRNILFSSDKVKPRMYIRPGFLHVKGN